jgi:hypothetical protein
VILQTTPKLPLVPSEEVISILSKFAVSFLFWTYFSDNSNKLADFKENQAHGFRSSLPTIYRQE